VTRDSDSWPAVVQLASEFTPQAEVTVGQSLTHRDGGRPGPAASSSKLDSELQGFSQGGLSHLTPKTVGPASARARPGPGQGLAWARAGQLSGNRDHESRSSES
jgi:hypothetical protein